MAGDILKFEVIIGQRVFYNLLSEFLYASVKFAVIDFSKSNFPILNSEPFSIMNSEPQ